MQRWVDSGLTAREYAAETGLNENTLAHWKWRLGTQAPRAAPRAGFVEVVAGTAAPEAAATCFELVLPQGLVLRVPPRFDAAGLRRLLTALQEART